MTKQRGVYAHCEDPDYTWIDNYAFLGWMAHNNFYIVYDLRFNDRQLEALTMRRGGFAPQWRLVPRNAWPDDIQRRKK